MFGLVTEKKYNDLKLEYGKKMAEIKELCDKITESLKSLESQTQGLKSTTDSIETKIKLIWDYLTNNGRKKTVGGIQYSDFELFIKNLDNPQPTETSEIAATSKPVKKPRKPRTPKAKKEE